MSLPADGREYKDIHTIIKYVEDVLTPVIKFFKYKLISKQKDYLAYNHLMPEKKPEISKTYVSFTIFLGSNR